VGQVGEDRSYTDELPASMKGQKVYYKIDVYYSFELNLASGGYHVESTTPVQGAIVGASTNAEGNPTVDYTTTDLGQVFAASSGIVQDVKEKMIGNDLYLGAITDASLYGKPVLYKLNGSSWQNMWSSVPDVEFDMINFAVSNTNSYLAGIRDSLSVFQWNGSSWSSKRTPDNLGRDNSPSAISIEVFNNELYMAIEQHPDYNLQVLKYTGHSWDTIGGDVNGNIASGSIYDPEIETIDGKLYLHYRIDDVLYIKRLEGATWISDLEWEQAWLSDIELVIIDSNLYFSSGSASTDFDGGVFRVENTSTVTNLIPEEHEDWFTMGAFDLTADLDGNLVVASMKYEFADESQIIYPHLNVYDGSEWKIISGDFTDGVLPVAVNAIDTEIYYIYGDASSVNATNDPSSIKSKKLTN
jgi:hypothetical protein